METPDRIPVIILCQDITMENKHQNQPGKSKEKQSTNMEENTRDKHYKRTIGTILSDHV